MLTSFGNLARIFFLSNKINAVPISIPDLLNVAENEGTVQVCATLHTDLVENEDEITLTLATSDVTGKCVQVS